MDRLVKIFNGYAAPGVYRLPSRVSGAEFRLAASRRGWRGWYLPGETIGDKAAFLSACAQEMNFPRYFGRNWDAFSDCLNDLAWEPANGYALLYDAPAVFAANQPEQWNTALEIFADAAKFWQQEGVPFFVLLRKTRGSAAAIPLLK